MIDFDQIAMDLGSDVDHGHSAEFVERANKERNALVTALRRGEIKVARAWIVSANPNAGALFPHHHLVTIDPGRDEVIRRSRGAGRPENWERLIDDWYEVKNTRPRW